MQLLKRAMVKRALKNLPSERKLTPTQQANIDKLLDSGIRSRRAFAIFCLKLDQRAEDDLGEKVAGKLGDGEILKMLIENLPEMIRMIIAALKDAGLI